MLYIKEAVKPGICFLIKSSLYHLKEINNQIIFQILLPTFSSNNDPVNPKFWFYLNNRAVGLRQFLSIAGVLGVVKSDIQLHYFKWGSTFIK